MNPHKVNSSTAEQTCLNLMDKMDSTHCLDFNSTGPDHRFSTAPLFGESRGQMFGILICYPKHHGGQEIILKAFSGQYNGIWEIPGWAPPLINPNEFDRAVTHADPPIKKLTSEIDALAINCQKRNELIEQRRILSQEHIQEIHEMYTIRNFAGEKTTLFNLFKDRKGIPCGTGDCCAPKLLNQAIILGLKPLSLAEFFWGRETRSGTKQHRCFYPPCEEKCSSLLNFMLRGADD